MDGVAFVLGGAVGLAVGGALAWLALRGRRAAADVAALAEQGERIATLREAQARLEAQVEAERRAAGEQRAAFADAETRLRDAFAALSQEALGRNNQSFLDLARTQLGEFQAQAHAELAKRQDAVDGLVAPLRESLVGVQQQLQAIEKERHGVYSSLAQQLQTVATTEQSLRTEVSKLAGALRAPTARGRWGELQLQRIVELAGMVEHCDYVTQTGTEGGLRPDMIVRLPAGKQIVVDAKAPLAAYLEALEASDDATRELKLEEHARQVRDHMKRLGAKDYQRECGDAGEFVVMFLPGEAFLGAALQADPALIEYGWDQRVVPASPTTLLALLRAVGYGWRHEALAENARLICEEGANLYDRLATMTGYVDKLGRAITGVVKAHDETIGALERRVLPAARKLRDLRAGTDRELPEVEPLGVTPRRLVAEELVGGPGDAAPTDEKPALRIVGP